MQEKIALVAPPWWAIPSKNIITATESLVEDYAFNLKKQGIDSVIFSRKKDFTDEREIEDVNGFDNKYIYTKVGWLDRKKFKKKDLFMYLPYIIKVARKIRKSKIKKVVVFQTFNFCYWIKILNPKAKVVFHIGGVDFSVEEDKYNYGRISDNLANKVLPKVDSIIAVSNYVKEDILQKYPKYNKVVAIHSGIDAERFKESDRKNENTIEIVYTGRVVEEKGIYSLLKAFEIIEKKFNNVNLLIVGGSIGPRPIVINNTDERIKVFPMVSRGEVLQIINKTHIFVHPTLMEEPFGLAPLEAGLCQNVLLLSNSRSGYSEVLEENVLYFNPNNIEELAEKLEDIVVNYRDYYKKTAFIREKIAKQTDWQECINKMMAVFND